MSSVGNIGNQVLTSIPNCLEKLLRARDFSLPNGGVFRRENTRRNIETVKEGELKRGDLTS